MNCGVFRPGQFLRQFGQRPFRNKNDHHHRWNADERRLSIARDGRERQIWINTFSPKLGQKSRDKIVTVKLTLDSADGALEKLRQRRRREIAEARRWIRCCPRQRITRRHE